MNKDLFGRRGHRRSEAAKRESFRKKSCEGKPKLTERAAKMEARRLSLSLGERIGAYECEFCNGWHVGHS